MYLPWRPIVLSWYLNSLAVEVHAKPQRIRVISDIHAGSCWKGNQTQLFEFLHQTTFDNVDTLVLNGDIYDFWLIPLNKAPPSLDNIVKNGLDPSIGFDMHRFRKLLHKAAKSVVSLEQDNGNHDMWLNQDLASEGLDDPDVKWEKDAVENLGISFHHGHRLSLFQTVWTEKHKLPIGYFVTRAVATYACNAQDRVTKFLEGVVQDALGTNAISDIVVNTIKSPSVFKKILEKIVSTAADGKIKDFKKTPVLGVVSPNRIPVPGDDSIRNYTLNDFLEDYSDTLEKVVAQVGAAQAGKLLETDIVGGAMNRLAGAESIWESLVVLGHTHIPKLLIVDRDAPHTSRTPDVLVANAGAWVADDSGKAQRSYVDIIVDDLHDDFPECYTKENGVDYRGLVHKTNYGIPCISWGRDIVKDKNYRKAFGDVSFCRNIGNWPTPWCWTGTFTWGNCTVGEPQPQCDSSERGPIEVGVYSYPEKEPMYLAWRNASTGSRWTMKKPKSLSGMHTEYV